VDHELVRQLEAAGMDASMKELVLTVSVQFDDQKKVRPAGEEVTVTCRESRATVRLKKLSELFVGSAAPPDFEDGPTPEFEGFFALIEFTAVDYCTVTGQVEPDNEFERLYRQLKRRPDGQDSNPLFSYLQAAARLGLSLRDTSRAEFEAVAARLSRSARTFSFGPTSRNYYQTLSESLYGDADGYDDEDEDASGEPYDEEEEAERPAGGGPRIAVPGGPKAAGSRGSGKSGSGPRCGLCGKTGKLTKTECCGNWICDDEDQYVAFSYARNSCSRNHRRFTLCGFHHTEDHPGHWQDCPKCRKNFEGEMESYAYYGTNEYNFEKLAKVPKYRPTKCSRCGKVIVLSEGGYMQTGQEYVCGRCSAKELPEFLRR